MKQPSGVSSSIILIGESREQSRTDHADPLVFTLVWAPVKGTQCSEWRVHPWKAVSCFTMAQAEAEVQVRSVAWRHFTCLERSGFGQIDPSRFHFFNGARVGHTVERVTFWPEGRGSDTCAQSVVSLRETPYHIASSVCTMLYEWLREWVIPWGIWEELSWCFKDNISSQ